LPIVSVDGSWGNYLKANRLLRNQVKDKIRQDAIKRYQSGYYSTRFHAEIENGNATGYQMLHGSNAAVGDFIIATTRVSDISSSRTITYSAVSFA